MSHQILPTPPIPANSYAVAIVYSRTADNSFYAFATNEEDVKRIEADLGFSGWYRNWAPIRYSPIPTMVGDAYRF
jgi:hypothetical protein